MTLVGSSAAATSLNNAQAVGTVGTGNPLLSELTGPYVTFTQGSTVKYVAIWVWAEDLGTKWVLYTVASSGNVVAPQTSVIAGSYTLTAVNAIAITGSANVTY